VATSRQSLGDTPKINRPRGARHSCSDRSLGTRVRGGCDPSYIGEEAISTAYTNVSVPQNWTVYSPTMRPPGNPSCVEVTTIYGPNNYAALGIWNWCPGDYDAERFAGKNRKSSRSSLAD